MASASLFPLQVRLVLAMLHQGGDTDKDGRLSAPELRAALAPWVAGLPAPALAHLATVRVGDVA
jgi:hypothetical protein